VLATIRRYLELGDIVLVLTAEQAHEMDMLVELMGPTT